MTAACVLLALTLACIAAPLYAKSVSHTNPFLSNIDGTIYGTTQEVMPQSTEGIGLGVTPIGPSWLPAYFLGADSQGRDVMARLLYGGRASLLIAGSATLICLVFAGLIGVTRGISRQHRRCGVFARARRALGFSDLPAGHFAVDRAD